MRYPRLVLHHLRTAPDARSCRALRRFEDVTGRGDDRQSAAAFKGLAFCPKQAYEWGMLTDGDNTPPGTQRLVDKSHRSCGAHRWQRPADAATENDKHLRRGAGIGSPFSFLVRQGPNP